MSDFSFNGLPDGIGQYFTTDFVGAEVLTEAEKLLLTNTSAQKRVKDFSTGRFCARQAMSQIRLSDQQILRKDEREPLWPQGVVGSISHSSKMVGAIVARSETIRGIGLDIETIGGVKPEMWRLLFTPNEQDFLKLQTNIALHTTLFFSFKESFYKMQYPLLQAEPDFLDVEIRLEENTLVMDSALFKTDELQLHWQQYHDQVISIVLS